MNGNKPFLLDTNAIIYLLSNHALLGDIAKHTIYISIITEIELLSYPKLTDIEFFKIKNFLKEVQIIGLTSEIKETTIRLRKKLKLKMPDALIVATASEFKAILVSNDKILLKIKDIQTQPLTII